MPYICDEEYARLKRIEKDLEQYKWEHKKVLEAIGSLPPGGSEFHDSPVMCAR